MTPRNAAPRILLVEDDEINRALLRAVLSASEAPELTAAVLVEADSLAAARQVLAAAAVDIVLLDIRLSDGSGLTLASELSEAGAADGPFVVALSAGVLPAERAAALAAGCHAFVDKPYTATQLVATLLTHLSALEPPDPL